VLLGFGVPTSGSWATPDRCVEIAQRAEALGYASLWTFQRLLSPLGERDVPLLPPQYRSVHDPLPLLAFLAGQTQRVRLGVAVVNAPYQAPLVLAKALTTLDHLSGGRLDAGIGIGWMPQELAAVGVPEARRGARADDFLRCLQAIWTDDVVDYDGEFYRVPRSRVDPKPVQQPHPPILMGGAAPAALRRAGRATAGWISSSQADLAPSTSPSASCGTPPRRRSGRHRAAVRVPGRGQGPHRGAGPADRSLREIRSDLVDLSTKGVTETFIDLNFDPHIGSPDVDPDVSMRTAVEVLEALAPDAAPVTSSSDRRGGGTRPHRRVRRRAAGRRRAVRP
jgi:probable F420-dependent oxidoreductase